MAKAKSQSSHQNLSPTTLTTPLLYCGAITPFLFLATTIICGFVLGNYNHFSRMVSELGTIGTPSQHLFTIGLVSCSILSIAFIFGLLRICQKTKLSTVPVWLLFSYSVSIGGAGIFPLPLRLHLIFGMPSILLFLSPLTSLLLWPKTPSPPNLKSMASLSFVIMSLGFLAFFPSVLSSFTGLKQRIFHLGWCVWFIYLSISFISMKENARYEPNSTYAYPLSLL